MIRELFRPEPDRVDQSWIERHNRETSERLVASREPSRFGDDYRARVVARIRGLPAPAPPSPLPFRFTRAVGD